MQAASLLGLADNATILSLIESSNNVTGNLSLSAINTLTQYVKNTCKYSCEQTLSNTTIIIGPGAITGPIEFTQKCSIINSNCVISSMIDNSISNILEALSNSNSLSTSNFLKAGIDSLNSEVQIEELIKNNILQLITSSCTFETNQKMTDSFVYVGDGSTTGSISFAQNAELSNLVCAIDVIGKTVIYNKATAETATTSSNKESYYLILGVAIFVIVLILILVIAYFVITRKESDKPLPSKAKLRIQRKLEKYESH